MKRLLIATVLVITAVMSAQAGANNNKKSRTDTTNYIQISGAIQDAVTKEPVVFASVSLVGTSIATVTNADGEFILKVPKDKANSTISISHLGYENKTFAVTALAEKETTIILKAITLPIDEVVIRSINPLELLNSALEKVQQNYSNVPEMQTSFYRETIKQDKKYVAVSEAVIDIYKAPYKTSFDFDRMKIYKGRKSRDVKRMDTILVKLQGGPKTSLLLDVVKNPGDILDRESFEYYKYELAGIITIDNRETYVVKFDQVDNLMYPLYKGNIYIDIESLAFTGLDFSLSEKGLPYASQYLVKKKPTNMSVEVISGHYLVRYRKEADKWYLNYVRSELNFDSKWQKKLFKSDIQIMLEMAVTDRDKENLDKFPVKESAKMSDVFAEQVSYFEDENFWGDYNTIKPDESIEIAIEKLNRKLKRRQ